MSPETSVKDNQLNHVDKNNSGCTRKRWLVATRTTWQCTEREASGTFNVSLQIILSHPLFCKMYRLQTNNYAQ